MVPHSLVLLLLSGPLHAGATGSDELAFTRGPERVQGGPHAPGCWFQLAPGQGQDRGQGAGCWLQLARGQGQDRGQGAGCWLLYSGAGHDLQAAESWVNCTMWGAQDADPHKG